jgi:hypothetical protein
MCTTTARGNPRCYLHGLLKENGHTADCHSQESKFESGLSTGLTLPHLIFAT